MMHPLKECIQKLGLTHRAFVVLYDISWERFRSCLYGYTDSIPPRHPEYHGAEWL